MKKKILILEDNFKNAALIKQLLIECDNNLRVYMEKDINHAYSLIMQNRYHFRYIKAGRHIRHSVCAITEKYRPI